MAAAEGAIITSLCWVQRGYANTVMKEYEPTKEELEQYKKVSHTLSK
jgi:hypothetical protein